jgi:ribosomal protein S16
MSVAIRFMRFGKKGYPTYRLVVMPKHSKRNGAYLENLGSYDPHVKPSIVSLNSERLQYWLGVGAQLSEGVLKIKSLILPTEAKAEPKKAEKVEKATTVKPASKKKVTAK